nr:MAG TPA: Phenol-soluble modulin alpha 4 peptide [Caudoviricetes sp.]
MGSATIIKLIKATIRVFRTVAFFIPFLPWQA